MRSADLPKKRGPLRDMKAVAAMRPLLVDISSGVETDKIKDRTKILAAVRAAREA